ncbi:MAG: ABC transporter substrate-binding protein, partial [Flavobacterium sp.]
MSRLLFLFFIALLSPNMYSQAWKGYFSYNNVRFLSVGQNKVFASSENAYFSKHLLNDDVKTVNTVDGLSGQNISAFYHNKQFNRTFVGYENGLII